MNTIRNVCVYCGSGPGTDPAFMAAANELGKGLAAAGLGLVYGGGSGGLMGEVARATLGAGGHVIGIIPQFLVDRELLLPGIQDVVITQDMHERKRLMFERADAFVALPGGLGTLEELVEQLTWAQLGQHRKPVLIADIAGYWSRLIDLLAHMRATHFMRPGLSIEPLVTGEVDRIIPMLQAAAAGIAPELARGHVEGL